MFASGKKNAFIQIIFLMAALTIAMLATSCGGDGQTSQGQNNDYAGAANVSVAGNDGPPLPGTIIFIDRLTKDPDPGIVTIWSMSPNGGEPQRIVNNTGTIPTASDFSLSPDCTRIMYSRVTKPSSDSRSALTRGNPLIITGVDGTNPVTITASSRLSLWAPDGKSVAYEPFNTEAPADPRADPAFDIRRSDTSGNDLGLIFTGLAETVSWSPDGTRLAFSNMGSETRFPPLCTIDINGSNFTKLIEGSSDSWARMPSWSPDSRRLVYVQMAEGQSESGGGEIWTIDVQTREKKQIWSTSEDGAPSDVTWSPDGSAILFSLATDGKRRELWLVNENGENPRRILNLEGNDNIEVMTWCNCAKIPDSLEAVK
ncbi:MAG: PD40 domain-containing protein [Actinobacteria bacterium]|nr:PD40 domain-containing protein [Actinomycetota bacterium]